MTKQEIVALIESAIAGQGSAVDVGGALPKILKGIVDLLPGEGPQALPVLEVTPFEAGDVTTESELLSKFKLDGKSITMAELINLNKKQFCVMLSNNPTVLYPVSTYYNGNNKFGFIAGYYFGFPNFETGEGCECYIEPRYNYCYAHSLNL